MQISNDFSLFTVGDLKTFFMIDKIQRFNFSYTAQFLWRTLFKKSIFCPKSQFWQPPKIFTIFSPKFFLTIYLVKSKLSTAKKFKTTTFWRVFHPPKKSTIFLVKSKLSTARKSKNTTFSRVFLFHPKKSTIISGNQSWIFE